MGSSSSKSSSSSSASVSSASVSSASVSSASVSSASVSSAAEIENAFADMFADAMERADWHGKRKPTWQQNRDHFVVQMRAGVPAVA